MKLKPETIMILQAGYNLIPAVHEVTDYKVKRQVSNLIWEILIVAAAAQGVLVDELHEYLKQNPSAIAAKSPPNKAMNPNGYPAEIQPSLAGEDNQ